MDFRLVIFTGYSNKKQNKNCDHKYMDLMQKYLITLLNMMLYLFM